MADVLEITFKKDRETKNKIRFAEVTEPGKTELIGTLYVSKDALKEIHNPDGSNPLTVVITALAMS